MNGKRSTANGHCKAGHALRVEDSGMSNPLIWSQILHLAFSHPHTSDDHYSTCVIDVYNVLQSQ